MKDTNLDTLCFVCGSEYPDTTECDCCGEIVCKDCVKRHLLEVKEEIRIACCMDAEEMRREGYIDFASPGGNSALRAETPNNPRNLPCPTCGEPDCLTPADRSLGYQCDTCADRAEGTYVGADY